MSAASGSHLSFLSLAEQLFRSAARGDKRQRSSRYWCDPCLVDVFHSAVSELAKGREQRVAGCKAEGYFLAGVGRALCASPEITSNT